MRLWLSAALLVVACGTDTRPADDDGDDQPPVSADACTESYVRYDNVAAPFVINWCRGCHSSSIPKAMRQKAPLDVNFDTEAEVRDWADRIEARATSAKPTMPPAGGPTVEERGLLREWIECGMR
jgi:uncharacterized membrane protein